MRVNYRNWPALQVVDPEKCAGYINDDWEHFFCAFNAKNILSDSEAEIMKVRTFALIYDGYYAQTGNIYYISKTFIQVLEKSAYALFKMLLSREECERVHEDCGMIIDDILWIVMHEPDGKIRVMRIYKEGCLFSSFLYQWHGDNKYWLYEATVNLETASRILSIYYLLMLLKRYGKAEIETLAPTSRKQKSVLLGEKVINEAGFNVNVLDSRWFTTICRDEGFLVSGHFRLQPCKDEQGEWTKKLIYINPYAKHGYHRMAPIVNLEANNE